MFPAENQEAGGEPTGDAAVTVSGAVSGTVPDAVPDAVIDRAGQELKVGHFAAARALLERAQPSPGPQAERVRALWTRLAPDPLAIVLVIACLLLFGITLGLTLH